jgi:hypothetical protein
VKTRFNKPSMWLFIPLGAIVAFGIYEQPLGMTVLVVVVFGFICTVLGCFLAIAHTESRQEMDAEALVALRERYYNAHQVQLVRMRKALLTLSARALRNAAGKMVDEFMPSFDNKEQFEAAVMQATGIVDAELNEIADLIGANVEDCDDVQVVEPQEDTEKT